VPHTTIHLFPQPGYLSSDPTGLQFRTKTPSACDQPFWGEWKPSEPISLLAPSVCSIVPRAWSSIRSDNSYACFTSSCFHQLLRVLVM